MVANARPATIADLDAMPDDGNRYELLNGEIVMAASPTLRHQVTVQTLIAELRGWARLYRLGTVVSAPFDVLLDEQNAVQPDIVFMSRQTLASARSGRLIGAVDIAVEVISPTNPNRDRVEKLFRYAEAGIPEYWIADPHQDDLTLLSLNGRIYVPQAPDADGRLHSVVLSGLVIDPRAIFAEVDDQMP